MEGYKARRVTRHGGVQGMEGYKARRGTRHGGVQGMDYTTVRSNNNNIFA